MVEKIPFSKVKEARSSGYSDDQILDFLGSKKNLSSKISQAREAGHSSKDILEYLAPPPSKLQSLVTAPVKGIVKGLSGFGDLLGGEDVESDVLRDVYGASPEQLANLKTERSQIGERKLEEQMPTKEGFAEEALEKAGEILPGVAGGGSLVSAGLRSLLAGSVSTGIKKAGGDPLSQAFGEIIALASPGLGKKIIASKSQKGLIDFARKYGLSEEEIAPLIPSKFKSKFFGKLAKKSGKAEERLKQTGRATQRIFEDLESSSSGQTIIPRQEAEDFLKESAEIMSKLPHSMRSEIFPDFLDFARAYDKGKGNYSQLMNLWNDVNHHWKSNKKFGLFKSAIANALKKGPKDFYEDFTMANRLRERFYPHAKRLAPKAAESIIDAGEIGTLIFSVLKMNFGMIGKVLGFEGARRLSREMLINPRLQNLRLKMLKAVNEGKMEIAKSLMNEILSSSNPKEETEQ